MRNHVLDAARAAAAYSVVLLHISFPGETGGIINGICRYAVPFFFLVSGYFCFQEPEGKVLKKMPGKVRHILSLAALACPFYILWGYLKCLIEGEDTARWLNELLDGDSIKNLICYNSTSPIRPHLWFLFALFYCYLLFWAAEKFHAHKIAYLLIPVLLGGNFWMSARSLSAGGTYRVMEFRNYLFTGFPFFMLGHLFHGNQKRLAEKLSAAGCLFLAGIGVVMTVGEYLWIGQKELFAGSILVSAGLFLFAVLAKGQKAPPFLSRAGEKYAFSIYLLHPAVGDLLGWIVSAFGMEEAPAYLWIRPGAVCLLSTFLAFTLLSARKTLGKFYGKHLFIFPKI